MCQISFQEWQLLPMGSYPRITDSRVPLQLYGPVGPFSTSYNRGMTAFLACMKVGPRLRQALANSLLHPSHLGVWSGACRRACRTFLAHAAPGERSWAQRCHQIWA